MKRKKASGGAAAPALTEPMRQSMQLTEFQAVETDPMGSYTGVPENPLEKPVQDADDL